MRGDRAWPAASSTPSPSSPEHDRATSSSTPARSTWRPAPPSVELIAEWARPAEGALLVDAAAAKGEAACTLAGRFACRVLALETYDPFVHYAAAKAWHWNLRDLVTVARGRGQRLPLRDASCDVAYCLGAPAIDGLEECLAELARVVKPNGYVFLSNVVWRVSRPEQNGGMGLAGPPRPAPDAASTSSSSPTAVRVEACSTTAPPGRSAGGRCSRSPKRRRLPSPPTSTFAFEIETGWTPSAAPSMPTWTT